MGSKWMLLALLLVPGSVVLGDDGYTIKQESPSTGTHIRQDVASSNVSMTKKYQELSETERNSVRGMYDGLPEGDEPPYPENGMKQIAKDMAKIQEAVLITGELFVTVEVDATGKGRNVKFYKIPEPSIAKPVALSLLRTRYKPAICSGKPCAMEFPFTFHFKVQ